MNRREFLIASAAAGVALATRSFGEPATTRSHCACLSQYPHSAVKLADGPMKRQFDAALARYMQIDTDAMLKTYRELSGLPAPGKGLGGWYAADGFAPGHAFGQWMSALSRYAQATGDAAVKEKVIAMVHGFGECVAGPRSIYDGLRFRGYIYDKHVIGLTEAYQLVEIADAKDILSRATELALKVLPEKALTRAEQAQRPHKDETYTWDEFYTLPENLFLASTVFGDDRYLEMAKRYLHDGPFFRPLAEGKNALVGQHAYSHVNALSSAAQAYHVLRSELHRSAMLNAWDFIHAQSYATGGWGPNEAFVEPGKGLLAKSLTTTHNHFETPCGSFAHFKLSRYLMRMTAEPRYGDSLERVLYNGIGAANDVQADGSTFYYSDYVAGAHKGYHGDKWPCCSGTWPQVIVDYLVSMYFHDDSKNIYVNLYAPSELKWDDLTLTQTTDYPDAERVSFKMTLGKPRNFTIHFRIPAWTASPAISVNGEAQTATPGTFAKITRTWRDGDKVELTIPLMQRMQAIEPETPNIVAELRGPVVYVATANGGKIPFSKVTDQAYTMYAPRN